VMPEAVPPRRTPTLLLLVGFAGVITAARLHTYAEPPERDLATYAVFGHEMLQGRSLYRDMWSNYTPAVFLTYAAAECVVGLGRNQFFALGLLAALVAMLGVWKAASSVGGRTAGLWAAAFWTICCSDLLLEANQPNTEVFINACLVWAFALFVRLDPRRGGYLRAVVIAILSALATVYKPVVVFIPAALVAAHLLSAAFDSALSRSWAFRHAMIIGAMFAAIWACVFAYFAAIGHLQDFLEAVVYYNRHYSGSFRKNLRESIRPIRAIPQQLRFTMPLYALSALAVVWGVRVEHRPEGKLIAYPVSRHRLLLMAYLVGVQLSVAATGHFHHHYYQLWLPALAIGGGWAVALLGRAETRAARIAGRFAGPAVLAALLVHELPNYRLSAEEYSREKYSDIFIESDRVGRRIGNLLMRGEEFYQCGNELGLYLSSRHRPPADPIWWQHLVDSPFEAKLRARVLAQLKRSSPEMIVAYPSILDAIPKDDPLVTWLRSCYRHIPGLLHTSTFEIYVRRGGTLESRVDTLE
jgi:4-amino-4-deoxy-L-arabinose transferase-like glycosyltransferase